MTTDPMWLALSHQTLRRQLAVIAILVSALVGCGETLDTGLGGGGTSGGGGGTSSGGGGTSSGGNATLNQACEAWCTDDSCMNIQFTDDFDECMLGCTTEQHSSPCDGPYATYISCLAAAGCVAQCTGDVIRWGQCEEDNGG
jgi:hypothetical protein